MDADKGETLSTLRYPLLATPKIDGIRCLIIDGVAMSRTMKPIPNRFIQSVIGRADFNGLDGELLVGSTFQAATSGIMSEDGEPDFTFYVFDILPSYAPGITYTQRLRNLDSGPNHPRLKFLLPIKVSDRTELDAYLAEQLALGHEGVMVRDPNGPYKCGRATFREGYLTKVKPFEDAEAMIVGFEEQMHNGNEATKDAFGRTERSSHKANLTGKGTLGALVCKNDKLWPGQTFNIGTGFDDAMRQRVWDYRAAFLGQYAKFKYQKIGTVDKPRIPVFLGFRDSRDT